MKYFKIGTISFILINLILLFLSPLITSIGIGITNYFNLTYIVGLYITISPWIFVFTLGIINLIRDERN